MESRAGESEGFWLVSDLVNLGGGNFALAKILTSSSSAFVFQVGTPAVSLDLNLNALLEVI